MWVSVVQDRSFRSSFLAFTPISPPFEMKELNQLSNDYMYDQIINYLTVTNIHPERKLSLCREPLIITLLTFTSLSVHPPPPPRLAHHIAIVHGVPHISRDAPPPPPNIGPTFIISPLNYNTFALRKFHISKQLNVRLDYVPWCNGRILCVASAWKGSIYTETLRNLGVNMLMFVFLSARFYFLFIFVFIINNEI